MSIIDGIEDIKSVNIRSIDIKKRLLMSSHKVHVFQSFLKQHIGNEVVIVNTNVGMEVYYYSAYDYSDFIKESILPYALEHIDATKLQFRNSLTRELVHLRFCEALFTFAQYPQIFLAYAKKFIHLREENEDSQSVMPILNIFFENGLQEIADTGQVPHYESIQRAKNKSKKSILDKKVIKNLISEILLKKRSN